MRLIVMGTPGFAVPTLQHVVAAGHEVCLVVCQPDRPGDAASASRSRP